MISAAITEALERIRAREERPDFTGPKIFEDWMIDIEDWGAGELFVVHIKDRLGHKIAVGQGPLALAALLAWEQAIGGGEKD